MNVKRVFGVCGAVAFCSMFILAQIRTDLETVLICVSVAAAALAAVVIGCAYFRRRCVGTAALILAVFLICGGLWAVHYGTYKSEQDVLSGSERACTLILKDSGYKSESGYYIYTAGSADGSFACFVKLITDAALNCDAYDFVTAKFSFSAPEDDYYITNLSQGVVASAYIRSEDLAVWQNADKPFVSVFSDMRDAIGTALDSATYTAAGFVKAVTIGDRHALSSHDKQVLRGAGLSHVVAVSGMHVSIFLLCLGVLLRPIKNSYVKYGAFIAAAVFVMCLCGFSPSVVRAALMAVTAHVGSMVGRRADSLNSLGLVVTGMLLFDPFLAVSVSFILSAGATLGIIVAYDKIYRAVATNVFIYMNIRLTGFPAALVKAFVMSLSAVLFTSPAMLWAFGEVNLTGLLSNAVCMPIIEVVFPLCIFTLVAGLILTPGFPVVQIFGRITEFGVTVFMNISSFFSQIQFSSAALNSYAAVIAIVAGVACYCILRFAPPQKMKKKHCAAISVLVTVLLCVVSVLTASFSQKTVTEQDCLVAYVDVGQGMGSAVICGNEAIVIDCGGSDAGDCMAAYLRRHGVNKVRTLIVSHLHDDHANGVGQMCREYEVSEIIIPFTEGDAALYLELMEAADEEGAKLTTLQSDQTRMLNAVKVELLSKHLDAQASDQNENSIVCIARIGDFSAMFTGDITSAAEKRLIKYYPDRLSVTVFGVPHHGSKYSSSQEFLERVSARIAVVSVGKNSYGHPDPDVLSRLLSFGQIYRTDQQGTVEIWTDGKSMEVDTEK